MVGVGASAGGLEAFKKLLKAIPRDSGMAYVLVQHLSPTHESLLPELLAKSTELPVHEITDDIKLAPDHIYVIPSNKTLTAVDGKLRLTPREESKLNNSIDVFFTSLAEVHQNFAVGIVLSGTGNDGSLGLKAIKENGGVTFAQEGQTAAYEGMPQSAMDTGMVDFILPPEEIPSQLLLVGTYTAPYLNKADTELTRYEAQLLSQILTILRKYSGIDFTYYKQATIRRRISRRMMLRNQENFSEYLSLLRREKEEQALLFQDLLIPVTSFFRDPKTFQAIAKNVLPALYKDRPDNEPLRIWVAGCSTGEEAFSIAICLHEFLGEKFAANRIQVFATDISEIAINKARKAIYSKADTASLTEEQLRTYFTRINGTYQVNKAIRDVCVFAVHNLLKDPPFARIDLISCRNVLIYMDNFLQRKTLSTFHYALKENGFLLLGKSETAGASSEIFAPFEGNEKIYTRQALPGRLSPAENSPRENDPAQKSKAEPKVVLQTDFRRNAESVLLARFTPGAVVINDQLDIVHIHGSLTAFLEPPAGKPSFNLIKMAREGLAFELRNAVHKAKESKSAITKENIPIKKNGSLYTVNFEVIPLSNIVEPHFLVLFHKITRHPPAEPGEEGKKISPLQLKLNEALTQISNLEKELAQSREDMRGITEEQEAANEELQSANEELLSSGEELQSLNEELETSKEELQSSNEELTVVNQELTDKQEQLTEALNYSANIIATIREPLIILDKALRVKSANASFYKKFNLTESETEGKLFYELQQHQWDDTVLRNLLQKILPAKTEVKDFEINLNFPGSGERTLLMNAREIVNENTAKLILLSIEDITDRKNTETKIEESEFKFRQLAETIPLIVWTATPEGKRNYFNSYLVTYTGFTLAELQVSDWKRYISPIDLDKTERRWNLAISEGKNFEVEHRVRCLDGDYCWHKTRAIPRQDSNGKITGWIGISMDIQEQKTQEIRKDEFISIASHELKSPITSLKGYIDIMHEMFAAADDQLNLQLNAKLKRQVEKLLQLANNLYDVNQMKADQIRLNKTRFNIDALISEVGESIQAGAKKHLIVMDLEANTEIIADRPRIDQVLTNLISNAIKYSPEADRVVLTSKASKKEVTFCIQDFGIGVSEMVQANIFNRYYRADEDFVKNIAGLGLGLYIASQIVNLHRGSLTVNSEPGKGSTFCVTIPVGD